MSLWPAAPERHLVPFPHELCKAQPRARPEQASHRVCCLLPSRTHAAKPAKYRGLDFEMILHPSRRLIPAPAGMLAKPDGTKIV